MQKNIKTLVVIIVICSSILFLIYPVWNFLNNLYLNSAPFKIMNEHGGTIYYSLPWYHSTNRSFYTHPIYISFSGKIIDDSTVKAIGECTTIDVLKLDNTNITNENMSQLEKLGKLRSLTIANTNIDDNGLFFIASLGLEILDISNTKITDRGLSALVSMSNMRLLSLKNTNITDNGILNLKELKKIQSLDLSNTKISDKSIPIISDLKELKSLIISNTGITDAGLSSLVNSNPSSLEFLDLSGTNITDEGLIDINKVKDLDKLNLCSTNITKKSLSYLKKCRHRIGLILSEKQISSFFNLSKKQISQEDGLDFGKIYILALESDKSCSHPMQK